MLEEIRAEVRKLKRGQVATYGEIAAVAGYPGAARQVVWALRNCGPSVPWHRIVGAGGRILLPAEQGLEQRLRLHQEGVTFVGDRVQLSKKQLKAKLKTTRSTSRKNRSEAR